MVQNIVSYTHTLIIMLALLLISCGGNSQNSSETILKKMKGDKYSGGIYRANEMAELRSLDPVGVNDATSHHIADQIYETLLTYDENLKLHYIDNIHKRHTFLLNILSLFL